MGKNLVLQGVDFANVAVAQISLSGKYYLTKDNYFAQTQYYPKADGTWGAEPINDAGNIYRVSAGDIVTVVANSSQKAFVAFISEIPNASETAVDFANNTTSRYILSINNPASFRIVEDCFIWVYNNSPGMDLFPQEIYTAGYPGDRTLTMKIADATPTGLYLKADGTFGPVIANDNPVEGAMGLFCLYKGETATIIANDSSNAYCALLGSNNTLEGFKEADVIQARMTIQKGETVVLTASQDCLLYLNNKDTLTDNEPDYIYTFPKSVKIKGV